MAPVTWMVSAKYIRLSTGLKHCLHFINNTLCRYRPYIMTKVLYCLHFATYVRTSSFISGVCRKLLPPVMWALWKIKLHAQSSTIGVLFLRSYLLSLLSKTRNAIAWRFIFFPHIAFHRVSLHFVGILGLEPIWIIFNIWTKIIWK